MCWQSTLAMTQARLQNIFVNSCLLLDQQAKLLLIITHLSRFSVRILVEQLVIEVILDCI